MTHLYLYLKQLGFPIRGHDTSLTEKPKESQSDDKGLQLIKKYMSMFERVDLLFVQFNLVQPVFVLS